jgi:hypothetical protein
MTIDEQLPQRMGQTIRVTKSMLTIFFNPKEFATEHILHSAMRGQSRDSSIG